MHAWFVKQNFMETKENACCPFRIIGGMFNVMSASSYF